MHVLNISTYKEVLACVPLRCPPHAQVHPCDWPGGHIARAHGQTCVLAPAAHPSACVCQHSLHWRAEQRTPARAPAYKCGPQTFSREAFLEGRLGGSASSSAASPPVCVSGGGVVADWAPGGVGGTVWGSPWGQKPHWTGAQVSDSSPTQTALHSQGHNCSLRPGHPLLPGAPPPPRQVPQPKLSCRGLGVRPPPGGPDHPASDAKPAFNRRGHLDALATCHLHRHCRPGLPGALPRPPPFLCPSSPLGPGL